MSNKTIQPYEITNADRAVGMAVILAVVLVFSAVILHYQKIEIGVDSHKFHSITARSYGIAKGADIRLSGISIGQIEDISLGQEGQVRIDISILHDYRDFVTEGSYLEVDSSIGLGSILGGSGLRFVSNSDSKTLLSEGSGIEMRPPIDLAEVMSEAELKKISDDIKTVLHNLAEVSETVADNQANINRTIANLEGITVEMLHAVQVIPRMANTIEVGFGAWREAGEAVSRVVDASSEDFRATASNARVGTEEFNETLQELHVAISHAQGLLAELEETTSQMPDVLSEGRVLIKSANELTESLNNHWLFGTRNAQGQRMPLPGIHPADKTLYEERPVD